MPSLGNVAYNLLIKPAISDALEIVGQAAQLFYGSITATQICRSQLR